MGRAVKYVWVDDLDLLWLPLFLSTVRERLSPFMSPLPLNFLGMHSSILMGRRSFPEARKAFFCFSAEQPLSKCHGSAVRFPS